MSQAIKISRAGSQGGIPIGRNVQRGDPGIFGFLGRLAGGAIRTGVDLVTRGPVAAASTASRNIGGLFGGGTRPTAPPGPFAGPPSPSSGGFTGPALVGAGQLLKGYHLNSSSYFLRDGTFIPAGTRAVKNRRRNPANARATSRAISRINGAKRMQHTLAQIETAKYSKAGARKFPGHPTQHRKKK